MIVGITGTNAAGKGSVAEILIKKGFQHYSVRYFLEKELDKRGLLATRDNLVSIANELRETHSPSYIVERLYELAKRTGGDCVIESIRSVGEVEALREKEDFILLAIDADSKTRYERAIGRKSSTDIISYEAFLEQEEREMENLDKTKQNLKQCISLADYKIENNGSLKELEEQVVNIFKKTSSKFQRDTWDEYFMKIAAMVAERSNCLRHHVGAIIVKDKRIVTTGYNGAARGIKDCLERGCLREELGITSGTRHEICRAIHAEQNAIIQGAFHGVSVRDGTMYCTHTPCMIMQMKMQENFLKKQELF